MSIKDYKTGIILLCLSLLIGCAEPTKTTDPSKPEKEQLTIVATTGMIKDLVENIVKDKAAVTGLMGAGVDPHLYKATQGDLKAIQEADIVFYNGLYLEGKMESILEKLAKKKPVFPISKQIDKSTLLDFSFDGTTSVYDPHIWMDVSMWMQTIDVVTEKLGEVDPANKDFYKKNGNAYHTQLKELNVWAKNEISGLDSKLLVTSHDAFGYFGRAYDIEVTALQGISTVTEFGLKDITKLVDLLTERKAKALFVESSMPQKPLEAVQAGCKDKGHSINMGGTLYADAMGEEGTPEGTYIGMVKHNVNTIVKALQ